MMIVIKKAEMVKRSPKNSNLYSPLFKQWNILKNNMVIFWNSSSVREKIQLKMLIYKMFTDCELCCLYDKSYQVKK